MPKPAIFAAAVKLQKAGYFSYNAGKEDLLVDILRAAEHTEVRNEHETILRRVFQQQRAIFCNADTPYPNVMKAHCCFAHIVKHRSISEWPAACKDLDNLLKAKLQAAIVDEDMSPAQVLRSINAEGRRMQVSEDWERAFEWLSSALPYTSQTISSTTSTHAFARRAAAAVGSSTALQHSDIVDEVINAGNTFYQCKGFPLRPCQLAAILLNVYGVRTGTKLLIEMKTGEGKTFVCGVSAAVVAKLFSSGPAVILTSSSDRADADKKATAAFVELYLEKPSIRISDLKPGENNGAGCVAYGQVSDAQRIVVDLLLRSDPRTLYGFLGTCSFFLDEADHVLIEQAESLLYIASPCPTFHALHALYVHLQYRLDYDEDFTTANVKTRSAIQQKAMALTERLLQHLRDSAHAKDILIPGIIHVDAFVATSASGGMSARFKVNGKEYVTELTTDDDHTGSIPNVPRITIVDVATGTESDGTRWTSEAPFIEAMQGYPIGGSDPLAFYSAFPYLLQKVRWYGGITGTVGAAHTLQYYGETFNIWATFRIPRNKPTTIYQLETRVASSEEAQVANTCRSIEDWLAGKVGLSAKGPALIVAESIQKARIIEAAFEARGHAIMQAKVTATTNSSETPVAHGTAQTDDEERVVWSVKGTPDTTKPIAHIFPYYRREHCVMETFPDNAVIIASNKGGRGLDLKLDHDHCPLLDGAPCWLQHFNRVLDTKMKSVLFVTLMDVLPGRQDEQALGRCGRCGKAGVVQYQLASKPKDSDPTDPVQVFIERKLHEDRSEENHLSAKGIRIGQHRFDGFVLDTFCDNLVSYTEEWLLKLFPSLRRKSSDEPPPRDGAPSAAAEQVVMDATRDESLHALVPVVRQWLREYVTEMWAYWRGYTGSRRQQSDFLKHFETRMGLLYPHDLPEAAELPNALQRFARRFWAFACFLRLRGEALYAFAKALLAAEHDVDVLGFCCDLANRASAPTYAAGNVSMDLPPDNHAWQSEFSGNNALLFAALSQDRREGLRRAKDATDRLIKLYSTDSAMVAQPYPKTVPHASRSKPTFYLVQRAEIVRQLKHRRATIEEAERNPAAFRLQHISVALKDPDTAFRAYCLGYGWCETIFEWSVGEVFTAADTPENFNDWANSLRAEARSLGAPSTFTASGATGGGGNAQVKAEEGRNVLERQGAAILARLSATNQINAGEGLVAANHRWQPTAPVAADIQASKPTFWQIAVGWITLVWAWFVTHMMAPIRKYQSPKGVANKAEQFYDAENALKGTAIYKDMQTKLRQHEQSQTSISGSLVEQYLGDNAHAIVQVANSLEVLHQNSDLVQEKVDIQPNGETANNISYADAKAQAKEAAAEPVHFHDPDLSKEDKYLINKTLEALNTMVLQQQLEGFESTLLQMMDAIARYNEAAQAAQVHPTTAARMHAAMKALWNSTLRFALDHGSKISELDVPLSNYNMANSKNQFMDKVSTVVNIVKDTVSKVVEVVKDVVTWVKGVIGWVWKKVKRIVQKVVRVVQQIPVVREVITYVKERVINPLYETAKNFIESAKEKLWSSVMRFVRSIRAQSKAVAEAIYAAATKLGNLASKAWDWLQTTRFWAVVSEKVMEGISWLSVTLTSFLNKITPYMTRLWQLLSNVWNVFEPLFRFFSPLLAFTVWICKGVVAWLRYWWQGASDIMRDHLWGNFDFDIIDVNRFSRGISRYKMRLRAALQRVWASSWLQYHLDPSIRLGMDIDQREHVQEVRQRAHQDYLQQEGSLQQRTSMAFAVIGVVISSVLAVAAALTGAPMLIPLAGMVSSVLSAMLQYASMTIEADRTISTETKETIQSIISIAQAVTLVANAASGHIYATPAAAATLAVKAVAPVMRFLGIALKQISKIVRSVADVLRIEQRAKGVLDYVDRILRMFGIGGAATVTMNIRNTVLGMAKAIIETASNILLAAWQLRDMFEKNNRQDEAQKEEDEDSPKDNSKHATTMREKVFERTLVRDDGFTFRKMMIFLGASSGKRNSSENELAIQSHCTSFSITREGRLPLEVHLQMNKEGITEIMFSRELFDDEKALLGLSPDTQPTADLLEALFDKEKDKVLSDVTITNEDSTHFNDHGDIVKRQLSRTSPLGEVSVVISRDGVISLCIHPNGDPRPAPMMLQIGAAATDAKEKISGDITEDHLRLLADFLRLDLASTEMLLSRDLSQLSSLAKLNTVAASVAKDSRETGARSERSLIANFMLTILNTLKQRIPQATQFVSKTLVEPLTALLAPLVAPLVALWNMYIAKTVLGRWLQQAFARTLSTVQVTLQEAWASVKNWISARMTSLNRVDAPNDEHPNGIKQEEAVAEEDVESANVLQLLEALVPHLKAQNEGTDEHVDRMRILDKHLECSILAAFRGDNSALKDATFHKTVEALVAQLTGDTEYKLSDKEVAALHQSFLRNGAAKTLYDLLIGIVEEKRVAKVLPSAANVVDSGATAGPTTASAALYEQMKSISANYARRNMKFWSPLAFAYDRVPLIIQRLIQNFATPKSIQQRVPTHQIQANIERCIRDGDKHGLLDFVKSFHKDDALKPFGHSPEIYTAAAEAQRDAIHKVDRLITKAWSQMSDETVATTTKELVDMLSISYFNLRIDDVDSPIAAANIDASGSKGNSVAPTIHQTTSDQSTTHAETASSTAASANSDAEDAKIPWTPTAELVVEAAIASDEIYRTIEKFKGDGGFSWARLEQSLPPGWSVVRDANFQPLSNFDGAILRSPTGTIIAVASGTRQWSFRMVADLCIDIRGLGINILNKTIHFFNWVLRSVVGSNAFQIGKFHQDEWSRASHLQQLMHRSPTPVVLVTGHSLGGAVAERVGRIERIPAIVFNAPNFDAKAAERPENLRIRVDGDLVSAICGAHNGRSDLTFKLDTSDKHSIALLRQYLEKLDTLQTDLDIYMNGAVN